MGANCGCEVQGCDSILWIILIFCICPGFSGGCGGFGGKGNSCIWIILLLCCCGGLGHRPMPIAKGCC